MYIYTYLRLVYRTAKSEACQRTRQDDNLKPLLPSAISQWDRISCVNSNVGIVREEMFSEISKNMFILDRLRLKVQSVRLFLILKIY